MKINTDGQKSATTQWANGAHFWRWSRMFVLWFSQIWRCVGALSGPLPHILLHKDIWKIIPCQAVSCCCGGSLKTPRGRYHIFSIQQSFRDPEVTLPCIYKWTTNSKKQLLNSIVKRSPKYNNFRCSIGSTIMVKSHYDESPHNIYELI